MQQEGRGGQADERIGSAPELRSAALAAFRRFLIQYPEDALAPEVSFSWATTALEGKDLETALEIARRALQRYEGSALEDELLYTVGYAGAGYLERLFSSTYYAAREAHAISLDRSGRRPIGQFSNASEDLL